jgi:hypothetical protein
MSYKSCDGVYHPEPLSESCEEALKAPPGHFWITSADGNDRVGDGRVWIHMKLPSAREEGAYCAIPIKQGAPEQGTWGWDGNREKPTLTPSIFHDFSEPGSSVAWHGFLRAGRFEGC